MEKDDNEHEQVYINIRFPADTVKIIDRICSAEGGSRSSIIRRIVNQKLAAVGLLQIDESIKKSWGAVYE